MQFSCAATWPSSGLGHKARSCGVIPLWVGIPAMTLEQERLNYNCFLSPWGELGSFEMEIDGVNDN